VERDTPHDLFTVALECLAAREADDKVGRTLAAASAWRRGEIEIPPAASAAGRQAPGLPERLRVVAPAEVPRRKVRAKSGSEALIHALAHIEFNAINLAWDCIERFRGLPRSFYDDWVSVADEEARHFALLEERLRELGMEYGDLPAHGGLWEMAEKTATDPIARMALVPRFLEARGLDVAPAMIDKLEHAGDVKAASILRRILADEVGHVEIGTRWFRYLCSARALDPDVEFLRLLDRYGAGNVSGPLNFEARRRAGFSTAEMAGLHARGRAGVSRHGGKKPMGV
jgi:uncharacterized ferritin-like protein (DUF455 family)